MKTVVLFFVLCAFAAVSASHNKKHKAHESDPSQDTHDWPQPQNVSEYGVPEDYSSTGSGPGPSMPPGQTPGDQGDTGRAHVKSYRRHHN